MPPWKSQMEKVRRVFFSPLIPCGLDLLPLLSGWHGAADVPAAACRSAQVGCVTSDPGVGSSAPDGLALSPGWVTPSLTGTGLIGADEFRLFARRRLISWWGGTFYLNLGWNKKQENDFEVGYLLRFDCSINGGPISSFVMQLHFFCSCQRWIWFVTLFLLRSSGRFFTQRK